MNKLKIYFGASISTDRSLMPIYRRIVDEIKKMGHEVLSEQVVNPSYDPGEKALRGSVFSREAKKIIKAEMMIAEVTVPSWGTAFLIEKALKRKIPVVALFHKNQGQNVSAMLEGHPGLELKYYNEDSLLEVIRGIFK